LKLEGGCNFRDIGGYEAVDGRQTRWGRVYRAGVLSYCSDADHRSLDQLGLRTICDLRRIDEREVEPTRWTADGVQHLVFEDRALTPTEFETAERSVAGMRNAMLNVYRTYPKWMAGRLQALFQALMKGDTPLIVHCAAGKDRTGVAIAVLMSAIGVPRETIMQDYLLTNEMDFASFILARRNANMGVATAVNPLADLSDEIRAVLMQANADYLNTALDQIDKQYGGMDVYLATLGVDDAARRKIADSLLT
jgi:protein-tyrosine phosphatase